MECGSDASSAAAFYRGSVELPPFRAHPPKPQLAAAAGKAAADEASLPHSKLKFICRNPRCERHA
jgi:hypothetical protein